MRIVVGIFFYFLALGVFAQPGDRYHRSTSFVDFKDSKTKLFGFKDSTAKLFGFKNEKGKVIVPAIYSKVYFNPNRGTWTVRKDSLDGLYSSEGKLILKPIYKFIESHDDINNGFIVVSKDNEKFGLTDLKGNSLLDLKYPRILDFRKNLLLVCEFNKDSIFNKMIIDTAQNIILNGKVLQAKVYRFVEDYPYDSSNVLYLQAIKNEKFALFSSTGRQISDYIFGGSFQSRDGLVMARLSYTTNTCGIIDQNNKIIIPFIYSSAGVADNRTIVAHSDDGKMYYFDSTGKEISKEEFKARQIKNPNWKTD